MKALTTLSTNALAFVVIVETSCKVSAGSHGDSSFGYRRVMAKSWELISKKLGAGLLVNLLPLAGFKQVSNSFCEAVILNIASFVIWHLQFCKLLNMRKFTPILLSVCVYILFQSLSQILQMYFYSFFSGHACPWSNRQGERSQINEKSPTLFLLWNILRSRSHPFILTWCDGEIRPAKNSNVHLFCS